MSSRFILPFADVGSGIKPSSGAQLFFFATGTATPKDTFSDLAATIPNANPVIANAVGVFPDIFITGTYKVVLKDKNNVQKWEADPVDELGIGALINDLSQAYEFATVTAMTSSTITFPLGKPLKVTDIDSTYIVTAGSSTNIGSPDLVNTGFAKLQETDGNVLRYGALDATLDNGTIINAAIADVNRFLIPKGSIIRATNVALLDFTHGIIRGNLKMIDNAPDNSSILINDDVVNGNKNCVLDFTGGFFDGNRVNQAGPASLIHHYPALFFNCSGFDVFGGTYGKNFAPETTPSTHPLFTTNPELFTQGVPYGENGATFPTVGMITFMGGRDNHAHDFNLIDWAQEGVSPRWNEGSSVTDFRAINGTETNEPYYAPVTFGSRAGSVTVAINDTVLVQEGHIFGGNEQQPHLIYTALVAGTYDLGLEDYSDGGRWTLVLRDITNDLGFTAARCSGAFGQMNTISNGYAAFCRASSFSNDSPMSGMQNLYSYHNSFQVGINFGHSATGADSSVSSNLTAINSGWSGGVGGSSYGINIVGATKDAQITNFYICGAGRNGINQSDSGQDVRLAAGIVKFSGAGGIKTSQQKMVCSHVTSRDNVGADFEPTGNGFIVLDNCTDSTGNIINNDKLDPVTLDAQKRATVYGASGKVREYFRAGFSVLSGNPFIVLKGDITTTTTDVMTITVTFQQRNTGSGLNANQYLLKETFLVFGTGTARTITSVQSHYAQLRSINPVWDVGTLELRLFLQDIAGPTNVAVDNVLTTCLVEIQNGAPEYDVEIGFEA